MLATCFVTTGNFIAFLIELTVVQDGVGFYQGNFCYYYFLLEIVFKL